MSYENPELAYTSIIADLQKLDMQAKKLQAAAEVKKKAEVIRDSEAEIGRRLEEANEEAEKILAMANEKAKEIAANAGAEADEILKNAYEQGYSEGAEKAKEEIMSRFEEEYAILKSLISQVEKSRETMIEELEDEIITLILDTSKKVINVALEKDDNVFEGLIKNALCMIKREGKIVVRVSQDDYSRFFKTGRAEFILNNELIKASVVEEPMFEKGDCVVESEGETVNAGVRSQLKYVELAFRSEESRIA